MMNHKEVTEYRTILQERVARIELLERTVLRLEGRILNGYKGD